MSTGLILRRLSLLSATGRMMSPMDTLWLLTFRFVSVWTFLQEGYLYRCDVISILGGD